MCEVAGVSALERADEGFYSQALYEILRKECSDAPSTVKKFIELLEFVRERRLDLSCFERLVSLHKVIAQHDGAVLSMLTIHYNLAIGTIRRFRQQNAWTDAVYRDLIDGRSIGVFLATELAHGNDLVALETQATYEPEKAVFVLNSPSGRAYKYMPNTVAGRLPKIGVVFARLIVNKVQYGIFPFLVPLSKNGVVEEGIKITPLGEKPGFFLDNAMTSFENVEVPYEGLLANGMISLSLNGEVKQQIANKKQRYAMVMSNVHAGKLCMAVSSVAAARAALYVTHVYLRKRCVSSAGERKVISFPYVQEKIAWDVVEASAHSVYLDDLAKKVSEGYSAGQNTQQLAGSLLVELVAAKARCAWGAQRIFLNCRELCGAQGLFSCNKISPYIMHNFGGITAEGDNTVLSLKVAEIIVATHQDDGVLISK